MNFVLMIFFVLMVVSLSRHEGCSVFLVQSTTSNIKMPFKQTADFGNFLKCKFMRAVLIAGAEFALI